MGFVVLAAACMLLARAPGAYAYIAYVVPITTTGNQNWVGSLGMDFDVLSPITVTELGTFASEGDLQADVTVQLWSRIPGTPTPDNDTAGGLAPLAEVVFEEDVVSYSSYGTASFFQPLKEGPLWLAKGHYTIVASGYGLDPNGNYGVAPGTHPWYTDSGGGALDFVGWSRYDTALNTWPTIADYWGNLQNPDRYAAGTFSFVPVPEPASLALLGLCVVGAGAGLRRRRRSVS